MELKNSCVVLI